ncbi:MAG: hypothetical protein H0V54_04990, partial [Chthoniobacterales bacterium]|nr:hypothetical protein [Chthoniobacterales bacterium]
MHLFNTAISRPRFLAAIAFCAVGLGLTVLSFAGAQPRPANGGKEGAALTPQQSLEQLQQSSGNALSAQVSGKTGAYSFVRAAAGSVIVSADKAASAKSRALSFLSNHGGLIGMTGAEQTAVSKGGAPAEGSELRMVKDQKDALGFSHVRLNQYYKGLSVFGAQVVVHMNDAGITAVNGDFAPGLALSTVPAVTKDGAGEIALATVRKGASDMTASVNKTELAVYPQGILEANGAASRLAYSVEVAGPKGSEQVWIDAQSGAVLVRIPLHKTAINRTIYSPNYDPANPDLFVQRREGDPPHPAPFVNNLYDFAGHTYNLYSSGFGFASYDGFDKAMISVYLINQNCPNAYWNGQSTNYCPAFDADDIVSHEWSHAYTEYT